jgi:hypothetical protein
VPPPPPVAPLAPPPPAGPPLSGPLKVEIMTLRMMRDKGIISQAEFDSAVHDIADTAGENAPKTENVVIGKWATTFYGFLEADSIYDSTRSLNDAAGNAAIARAGTLAGDNSRWTMGIRNSRFGFRMKAPEWHSIRASAQIESDWLGTQLAVGTGPYQLDATGKPVAANPAFGTEGAVFSNPTFRARHVNLKVETPVVDILFGQYWTLFGWQSQYDPATVDIQGVPGQLFLRTPQFRLSKTVKASPITLDFAIAAVRPVQRDGGLPDGEAGIKFAVDSWTAVQTQGNASTQISPFSIAVSGLLRHVAVNRDPAQKTNTADLTMSAIAANAFIPVIPGSKDHKDNSFALNGEFSTGYGAADQYTGLTGGIGFAAYPGVNGAAGTAYSPNIDPGIVTFDYAGKLHGIQWTAWLFGAQYYLPGVDGKIFISGNYSHMQSANSHYYTVGTLGSPASVVAASDWFDVNLFGDLAPSTRFGIEYANYNTMYVDGVHAINHRVQFSGFFMFY